MPKNNFNNKTARLGKPPAVNIKRDFYTMASIDGDNAEITMYGEIVSQKPTDWFGEPIEGQYIIESEFLNDLKAIEGAKVITIKMNSLGGQADVSIFIHNKLRELAAKGTALTCIVDGVAMSGGSLIMCACDTVSVNPSSLIMIHKAWTFLFGGYNSDELLQLAESSDAWDRAQMSIYARKTKLSETVILHMMSDTTYMTGREAIEKGFADKLLDDAEQLNIAASADRHHLFFEGKEMLHLAPGMVLPESIPTVKTAKADKTNNNQPSEDGGKEEGGTLMAKTLEQLRKEDPELAQALMDEAQAATSTETESARTSAAEAERKRIEEIDSIAGLYDEATVKEAKYGEKACTAQEMAFRAAQAAAKQGQKYVAELETDTKASGAEGVTALPNGGEENGQKKVEADVDAGVSAAKKAKSNFKEDKQNV